MIYEEIKEQKDIIDEPSHFVVIASPGSGKTFTISQKIRRILPELPDYRGVIAISFTNKASEELETRCLANGLNRKQSFFGTIDKFFLTEIIFPFAEHVWRGPDQEPDVVELSEIEVPVTIPHLREIGSYDYDSLKGYTAEFQLLYSSGIILLEYIGFMGMYILAQSLACRNYIKARYSHVFIDEYQDCDYWQDLLFLSLKKIGLICGAVGDPNQSIFAFARKSSTYLVSLANKNPEFRTFPLSYNRRCHQSIIEYSTKLISPSYEATQYDHDEIKIFDAYIEGSETDIVIWIQDSLDYFLEEFDIAQKSEMAILTRGKPTGDLISSTLTIPHKYYHQTPLDNVSSLWGNLFIKLLFWIFDEKASKHELAENYLNIDFERATVRRVIALLGELEAIGSDDPDNLYSAIRLFHEIAELIFPGKSHAKAVSALEKVLTNRFHLENFISPEEGEIKIMTLHKSKGLEFDLVFHFDLYKFIIPPYKAGRDDELQALNLHYVGITRARKGCVLCSSSLRHKRDGSIIEALKSPFFDKEGLSDLRLPRPV